MTKPILTVFLSSASFLTLLIMAQTANANPLSSSSDIFSQIKSGVNLNISSPYLSTIEKQQNPILEHLSGCNCLTCTKSVNPVSL